MNNNEFEKEIQTEIEKNESQRNTRLMSADAPEILRKVGLADLPMIYTQTAIREITELYPQNASEIMALLTERMKDPALVMDSFLRPNEVSMLVNVDQRPDGLDSLVVSISPGAESYLDGKLTECNLITSISEHGIFDMNTEVWTLENVVSHTLYVDKNELSGYYAPSFVDAYFPLPEFPFKQLIRESCNVPRSALLEAYVFYPGKEHDSRPSGEWVSIPTTAEHMKEVFDRIGIDRSNYGEWYIRGYNSDIPGLANKLSGVRQLDELNYLGVQLETMSEDELEKFAGAVAHGKYTNDLKELINLTTNLDCFDINPDIRNEDDLGRMYLLELKTETIPDELVDYIDYAAYGRDAAINEGGVFTEHGYVTENNNYFSEWYQGQVPQPYRITPEIDQLSPRPVDFLTGHQVLTEEGIVLETSLSVEEMKAAGYDHYYHEGIHLIMSSSKKPGEYAVMNTEVPKPEYMTNEWVRTSKGNFQITTLSANDLQSVGYKVNHSSEDGKFLIMSKDFRSFAVKKADAPKPNVSAVPEAPTPKGMKL